MNNRKKTAQLLKSDGSVDLIKPADESIGFTREELIKHLECDWLEFVNHPDHRNNTVLVCDEEAKTKPNGVVNQAATEILADEFNVINDHLVGHVIIVNSEFLEQ